MAQKKELFKWKNNFSVNNPEIDEQHQKLFNLGNQVYDLISVSSDTDNFDEIMVILKELTDYTSYHFKMEEELLKKYNYNQVELEQHIEQHKAFIKKISKVNVSDLDENQTEFLNKTLVFIADWITSHILETDKRYSDLFY